MEAWGAVMAMAISQTFLFALIGTDIYGHLKSLFLAILMPFEPRAYLLNEFHMLYILICILLTALQIMYQLGLSHMCFYLILRSRNFMEIFTRATGILFINSIDDIIGLFMRMWLKKNKEGYAFFTPVTVFR